MRVQRSKCIGKHPGGKKLTNHVFSLCKRVRGTWLDIGCGSGESVRWMADTWDVTVIGLDQNPDVVEQTKKSGGNIMLGEAHALPFEDASMDGILMECTLSLMKDARTVLRECKRVLKMDGLLVISDLYARENPVDSGDLPWKLYTKDQIRALTAGFVWNHYEDHSSALRGMMGQMLLNKGAEALYCEFGDRETIRKAKIGYYILIAQRDSI